MDKRLSPRKYRYVNSKLRFRIFNRDRFRCMFCGRSPVNDPDVVLEVDHIVPFSKGGKTEFDNLQTLCMECNSGKGALSENEPPL